MAVGPPPTANGQGARVPPHDLAAERALLGAMLLTAGAVAAALEVICAGDFYRPAHAHVFAAIEALYAAGEPVDTVTVAAQLQKDGFLEAVGGPGALVEMQASTPVAGNADHYARIVDDRARRRALIGVAGEIAELAYGVGGDIDDLEDEAQALVFAATRRRDSGTLEALPEVLDRSYDRMVALSHEAGPSGVTTGFEDIDRLLLGLQGGTLVILGARPSMGKTSLALTMAVAAAAGAERPVLFFSAEMSKDELGQRVYVAESGVPAVAIRTGRMNEAQWEAVDGTRRGFAGATVEIDDSSSLSVLDIRTRARRRAATSDGGIALIVVDYLQLLSGRRSAENRQIEVSEMSRGLKTLARELDCPVLALSQLSRGPEARTDKRPILADLRDSGAIEQDADVVMFLYRDEHYDQDSAAKGTAELHVAKHRSGPTGLVRLAWQSDRARFAALETRRVGP